MTVQPYAKFPMRTCKSGDVSRSAKRYRRNGKAFLGKGIVYGYGVVKDPLSVTSHRGILKLVFSVVQVLWFSRDIVSGGDTYVLSPVCVPVHVRVMSPW